ncbi:MAG: hypothetical protein ACYDIA_00085 [Candidatus Humimicrobiaceae bacterium]
MDNPYLIQIVDILNNLKVWLFSLIGIVTLVVVVIQAFKYQAGDASEKQDAIRHIRNSIVMGAGIFILAWFATYVINKMAGV